MMLQRLDFRKADTNTNNVKKKKEKTFRRLKRLCFLVVDLWAPHGEGREREGGLAAEPNWVVEVVWWRPSSVSHSKIRTQR